MNVSLQKCLQLCCAFIFTCLMLYVTLFLHITKYGFAVREWFLLQNSIQQKASHEVTSNIHISRKEHHVVGNSTQQKVLSLDAQFIVKSVMEAQSQRIPVTSDPPVCEGDQREYEVEDLLCIPRPKYLANVKNPCWWDKQAKPERLRCLPYFHILGCEKCGSTDLWNRISSHPHVFKIHGMMAKEASWWSWGRYGFMNYQTRPIRNFNNYTDSFMPVTQAIESSLSNRTHSGGHRYFITGDATPSDLTDFRGWPNITQNRGLKQPRIITPHLMEHFYVKPKFIIIYRDPIERFYSEYFHINRTLAKSATQFHDFVLKSIRLLASCIRDRSVRECAFDAHIYSALPVRLHFFFYSLYIPEWFARFPREKFLILKTEAYAKDVIGTLRKCFDFLGLEPLVESKIKAIAREKRSNVGQAKKALMDMLPATRQILLEMAKPTVRVFADIIGDDKFDWYKE